MAPGRHQNASITNPVCHRRNLCIYIAGNKYTIHMQHTFLHPSCQYLLNVVKFTEHSTVVTDLWHIFPWKAQIWHEHWAHVLQKLQSFSLCGSQAQCFTNIKGNAQLWWIPKICYNRILLKWPLVHKHWCFCFMSAYTEGCKSLWGVFSFVHVCNSDRPIWVKV